MLQGMEAGLPFAVMIMVESTDVVASTLSKAAMAKGISNLVFVVYSNALATLLLLLPFLFFSCRNREAPLSFNLILGFFLLGLVGSVGQMLSYTGIKYSSPALLSAMANLIPIFTFMLAVVFRMEKVDWKRNSSKAKCVGTILAVSGASIVTLYKGPVLIMASSSSSSSSSSEFVEQKQQSNWVFGGFLFLIVCLLSACWHIAQTWMVKAYTVKKMTNVFFFTFFVTLQSAAFAVVVETDPTVWQLRPDIQMLAVVFSGVFGSVIRVGVHTWCLEKKGPLYVVMFKPLGMVLALALLLTFLHDTLFLGSVMGSLVIGCGFYTVIWGQMKEHNSLPSDSESSSTSLLHHSSPLEHT